MWWFGLWPAFCQFNCLGFLVVSVLFMLHSCVLCIMVFWSWFCVSFFFYSFVFLFSLFSFFLCIPPLSLVTTAFVYSFVFTVSMLSSVICQFIAVFHVSSMCFSMLYVECCVRCWFSFFVSQRKFSLSFGFEFLDSVNTSWGWNLHLNPPNVKSWHHYAVTTTTRLKTFSEYLSGHCSNYNNTLIKFCSLNPASLWLPLCKTAV